MLFSSENVSLFVCTFNNVSFRTDEENFRETLAFLKVLESYYHASSVVETSKLVCC